MARAQSATDRASDPDAFSPEVIRGIELLKNEHYDEARKVFENAYAQDHDPETLLKLGMADGLSGHYVEARAHLHEYLERGHPTEGNRKIVLDRWLAPVEQHTAELDLFVPQGAQVLIDGAPPSDAARSDRPPPPVSLFVQDGSHDVAVRIGAKSELWHVSVKGGERLEIRFEPMPPASAPEASPVRPVIASSPPPSPATGQAPVVERQSRSSDGTKWVTVFGLGGAAVIAAGVGTAFAFSFGHASTDASRLVPAVAPSACVQTSPPAACAELQLDRNEERTSGALATGFLIGAGGLAAGALAAWLLWPSSPSPARSSGGTLMAMPLVGAREGGLALTATW